MKGRRSKKLVCVWGGGLLSGGIFVSVGMCVSSGERIPSMLRAHGYGATEVIKLKTPGGLASNHLPGESLQSGIPATESERVR